MNQNMINGHRVGGGFGPFHLLLGLTGAIAAVVVQASYPMLATDGGHLDRAVRQLAILEAYLTGGTFPAPSPAPMIPLPISRSRVFHATDYGADPTGAADSTAAIKAAIADAFAAPQPPRRTLMPGIPDLGGAEVHLDGGAYLISSPLTLPSGGNVKIHGGSLRAAENFPASRYLIELWDNQTLISPTSTDYRYEFVTLRDLMLDASYRSGGIAIVGALRTTVDNCYIVHFATDGVWVRGGHETYIRASFIGQHITAGADPGERQFTGTGINLAGNDNAVTDVVVFSAAIGVLVAGQANALSGVHCYNKASGFGGVGIYLKIQGMTQTRIVNCYLDFTDIVAEDPDQLHISSSFFLGGGAVVLKAVKGVARRVEIVGNMFAAAASGGGGGSGDIVRVDGDFGTVEAVRVERNAVEGMRERATVATAAVEGNGTVWVADFSTALLFPNLIEHVQYTLACGGSAFPGHVLRNVSGNRVVVETDRPVQATVHVAVDQSAGGLF